MTDQAQSDDPLLRGEELSPWDILVYLGQIYIRVRSIRTTIHQMRYNLVVLPDLHQNPDIKFTLVWALPQFVFSAVEALNVLSRLDPTLNPRSQVYTKLLRKWEAFRDDSAHYALRLFDSSQQGAHELRTTDDFGNVRVESFSYEYETGMLTVGDRTKNQTMSVIDALDALRAIFFSLERSLENEPEKYPQVSRTDVNLSRSIWSLREELVRDVDSFDDADVWFDARFTTRAEAILRLLKSEKLSEAALYVASGLPRSTMTRVLTKMIREKQIIAEQQLSGEWIFVANRDGL